MKPTADRKACTVEGCRKQHVARGYCRMHYQRWWKYGTPDRTKYYSTPAEAFEARTEWRGDCLIWTGATIGNGYGNLMVNGHATLAHRYAWEQEYGEIPDGMELDHRDHCDTRCVNVAHLRLATKAENMANRRGAHTNSVTGVRNVSNTRSGNYIVRLQKNGEQLSFGTFATLEEAAAAAERARQELFGEYAGRG